MTKTPNSRRNLDEAIRRVAGPDAGYIEARAVIANTVVGQLLPSGVVKGGSALKMRFGNASTRFTTDLDVARRDELESFVAELSERLAEGWNGFTGRVVRRRAAQPEGVPPCYVMQPFEIKLAYRGKSWLTVPLEVGHDEIGDADEAEMGLAEGVVELFEKVGLSSPEPVPLMPLHYQVAQKLHGLTEHGSKRAHDLIDLQIMVKNSEIDLVKTRRICERLLLYRRAQAWPAKVVKGEGWQTLCSDQAEGLDVIQDIDNAVAWANDLIKRIVRQTVDEHLIGER